LRLLRDPCPDDYWQFFPDFQDFKERFTLESKYREKLQLASCQTNYQQSGILGYIAENGDESK